MRGPAAGRGGGERAAGGERATGDERAGGGKWPRREARAVRGPEAGRGGGERFAGGRWPAAGGRGHTSAHAKREALKSGGESRRGGGVLARGDRHQGEEDAVRHDAVLLLRPTGKGVGVRKGRLLQDSIPSSSCAPGRARGRGANHERWTPVVTGGGPPTRRSPWRSEGAARYGPGAHPMRSAPEAGAGCRT